jgi:Uma2 family endonuclease
MLVVEFLSKLTRSHDLGRKLTAYRDAGIPEIWFVDDRDHSVIAERRVGQDYQREHITEGRLISSALPGFWLELAWVWAEPLPDHMACLQTILGGPPA